MRSLISTSTSGAALSFLLASQVSNAQNITSTNSTAGTEPCAQLTKATVANVTQLDAAVAYACLQSIPVDVDGDIAEIEGLKVLVQFESDLSYLKDPPPGFLYPAVDILGSLDKIQTDVKNGVYKNDYDVQNDLYSLVVSAYDFHFNWVPDLLGAFNWFRAGSLISLSSDGTSLPSVYDTLDYHALLKPNTSDYTPSAVSEINGIEVEQWLNEYAALNPWDHDPDGELVGRLCQVRTVLMMFHSQLQQRNGQYPNGNSGRWSNQLRPGLVQLCHTLSR
jgi:hypothetical protein